MKAAIYIEQKIKKGPRAGETLGWAGYIYADREVEAENYTYLKDAMDQWGNSVKVYRASEITAFEHPGGTAKTDLVVLFTDQPTAHLEGAK